MISDEIWQEHIEADRRQDALIGELSRQGHRLTLAMFGDEEKPDTVRVAMYPTIMRLNTWLDLSALFARVLIGVLVGLGALITILKTSGLI